MPTLHITIINNEKIFVNFYPILGLTWEYPVIELQKGSDLFEKYKKQFEEVWKISQPPSEKYIAELKPAKMM